MSQHNEPNWASRVQIDPFTAGQALRGLASRANQLQDEVIALTDELIDLEEASQTHRAAGYYLAIQLGAAIDGHPEIIWEEAVAKAAEGRGSNLPF